MMIIILMSTFHKSVLICIPIFFCARGKLWNGKVLICMFAAVIMALVSPIYNLVFDLNSVQTRQCASEIKFYGGLYDSQWANVKHIEDALVNICAGLHLTENRAKEMLSDDYEL